MRPDLHVPGLPGRHLRGIPRGGGVNQALLVAAAELVLDQDMANHDKCRPSDCGICALRAALEAA